MKKILFVEQGTQIKNYAIDSALEIGLEVYIVSNTEFPLPLGVDVNNTFISDTLDSHTLLIDTLSFMEDKLVTFDAVVTFRESCVIPTADVTEALGLKGVSSEGARRSSQNKAMMRHRLKQFNFFEQPEFKIININKSGAESIFNNFSKPFVIKPLFGTASHGVLYCDNTSNFSDIKNHLLSELTPETKEIFKKFDGTVLIEEFKEGSLISVDGIVKNSKLYPLGTLEFVMGEKPYFTQTASYMPARVTGNVKSLLYKKTEEIISILGFKNCGIHAEFRVDGDKVWLVEIAARLAGATIHDTYKRIYDTDLVKESLLSLISEETPKFNENHSFAYHHLIFANAKETSILKSVEIQLDNIYGILDLIQYEQAGSKIYTYPKNPTPILGYLLIGADSDALLKKATGIDRQIKIVTEALKN